VLAGFLRGKSTNFARRKVRGPFYPPRDSRSHENFLTHLSCLVGRKDFTASCCRAPWFSAHLDQYAQSVDLSEIWAGGTSGSANIQDDACDGVNPASTVLGAATAHYIRDSDPAGNASCVQFTLNTDPKAKYSTAFTSTEYFTNLTPGSTSVTFPANSASAIGVVIPQPIRTSTVDLVVNTPDTLGKLYDIGFINASGVVVCHTGAVNTPFASTGNQSITWAGSPCLLTPGKYYLGMTSSCTSGCAAIQGGQTTPPIRTFFSGPISVSSPGTLNNISPPPDSSTTLNIPALWVHSPN